MAYQPKANSKVPSDVHHGPGIRRTPSNTVGPAKVVPRVNKSAQSDRSKAADSGKYGAHGSALGDNPHEISRDGLIPSAADTYGNIGAV